MFNFVEQVSDKQKATIKVVGVGGGGGNAVNTMVSAGMAGVRFIATNTDQQALLSSRAEQTVQLGSGLGAGGNPEVGCEAAINSRDELVKALEDTDMVFITAGMGGGTGTGAAPIIAELARETDALTVAVVTKPFLFEGSRRMRQAEEGIDKLRQYVDTLITIPNQKLINLAGKDMTMLDAFKRADEILLQAVQSISDLIVVPGVINLDLADVRTIMRGMGLALMGTGVASGSTRAIDAAQAAISSPLLENIAIDGAKGVLINVTGGHDLTLAEVSEASEMIQEAADPGANIIFGAVIDERMQDQMRITVIATGFDQVEQLEQTQEQVTYLSNALSRRERLKFQRRPEEPEVQRPEVIEQAYVPQSKVAVSTPVRPSARPRADEDEYDIPTFIRRKAD
ncbi:MAG: cell division protein FtsZ [Candidatus Alcyoniella australis]|nr:cell division protein FtsZ [Candidatus Alcyoniella australis]